MKSWCDKLASVPGAGFKLDPRFASADAILNELTPLTNKLFKNEKQLFRITNHQSFDVHFVTDDGFNYSIEPTKTALSFKHRMRSRAISAGPPIMEMLSRARPYSQLLSEVTAKLVEATRLTAGSAERSVNRIGIISTTSIAEEEVPPGFTRFIEYLGRPWGGNIPHFNVSILAEVGKGAGYLDRCIHTIQRPEDKDQLVTITLDWQRVLTAGVGAQSKTLSDMMQVVEKAAIKYFEDVGEGKRFDEEIIREAART